MILVPPPSTWALALASHLLITHAPLVLGFRVTGPADYAATFPSSGFAYYGPQNTTTEALGVVLDGSQLCEANKASVEGKVVIIGEKWPLSVGCNALSGLSDLYAKMDGLGAAALVFTSNLALFPPGSMIYHFEYHERCKFCNGRALLVHLDSQALVHFKSWEGATGLYIELESTLDKPFQDLFAMDNSWWMILMRVFLPLLCFFTVIEAGGEVSRLYASSSPHSGTIEKESRVIAMTVCSVEIAPLSLIGSALAAGLYGPYYLPIGLLNASYGLFHGCGIFTTFALALYLREECCMVLDISHVKRPLWAHYRRPLLAIGVLTIGIDVGCMVGMLSSYYSVHCHQ